MQLLFYMLFVAGVVAADQITKLWVVENIPMYGRVEAIPGLFHLTYVQNTGAAFSAMEGMRWLFVLVFLAFTGAVLYEYRKKTLPFTKLERWCIAAIYAGGLGNILDRIFRGYVVDMIAADFIRFPVFNVADCFISCGCILLMVHLAFFNKNFWKEEKKP